jgi:hypothetical protein
LESRYQAQIETENEKNNALAVLTELSKEYVKMFKVEDIDGKNYKKVTLLKPEKEAEKFGEFMGENSDTIEKCNEKLATLKTAKYEKENMQSYLELKGIGEATYKYRKEGHITTNELAYAVGAELSKAYGLEMNHVKKLLVAIVEATAPTHTKNGYKPMSKKAYSERLADIVLQVAEQSNLIKRRSSNKAIADQKPVQLDDKKGA